MEKNNLNEFKRKIGSNIEFLRKNYNVKTIGIFGSFARGDQKKTSDIDIIVEFKKTPDLLKFIELERYFEKLLRIKVDLVRKFSVRPELKDKIFKEVVQV